MPKEKKKMTDFNIFRNSSFPRPPGTFYLAIKTGIKKRRLIY
jgi:hypothetical protein